MLLLYIALLRFTYVVGREGIGSVIDLVIYSGANWKVYEYCFIKQKYQIQMGIAQYSYVAMHWAPEPLILHISTLKWGM